MTFLITNNFELTLDDRFCCQKFPGFNFFYIRESVLNIFNTEDGVLIYRGYFGSSGQQDNSEIQLIDIIRHDGWPLPLNWSGSFNFVYFNEIENSIYLGTDAIGIYPSYYFIEDEKFAVSDSLILNSIAKRKISIDETGVFQRMVYEFSNFGKRTIIKNVKRLLPGELVKFTLKEFQIQSQYDNSLYGAPEYNDLHKGTVEALFKCLKDEYDLALRKYEKCYIGLSGGLDSRLILGLISNEKVEECLTYGNEDMYETKIARKLAKAYDHSSKNYFSSNDIWPTGKELGQIVHETESASVSAWNTILKYLRKDFKRCIILGDMCESLPGRNIKAFSSRSSRISRFWSSIFLGKPLLFHDVTSSSFQDWERNKLSTLRDNFVSTDVFQSVFKSSPEVIDETLNDLEETLSLIKNHDIKYTELYDELFEWYVHSRIPMGKQLTIFGEYFDGLCPSMGLKAIRSVSKIHPKLRIDYHFMDALFKTVKSYKPGLKIPTAQIPFIPQYYPNSVKLLVWGIRSKIDNYLIARIVKHKNHKLRYRLLESINWPAVYHDTTAEQHLNEYFVEEYFDIKRICYERFYNRKQLKDWPLANNDIINLAALNIEIGYILKNKKEEVAPVWNN